MEYNFDKCPECGYVNVKRPDVCPSCGCDWASYRKELRKKQEAARIKQAEEDRLAELNEDYVQAIGLFNAGLYKDALIAFMALGEHKDSIEFAKKCKETIYQHLIENFNKNLFLKHLMAREGNFEDFLDPLVQNCWQKYKYSDFEKIKESFKGYESYKRTRDYIDCCDRAIDLFSSYLDQEADYAIYCQAVSLYDEGKYEEALAFFSKLSGLFDADSFTIKCQETLYQRALDFFAKHKYESAIKTFKSIPAYKDASKYIRCALIEKNRIKQERAKKQRAEESAQAEKRKAEELAQQKKNRKDAAFHTAVYCLPLVLSLIFAIILFLNKEQISIVSSFGWWCFGWVVFTLISLGIAFFFATEPYAHYKDIRHYAMTAKSRKETTVAVLTITLLCLIIGFFNAIKLEPKFEPTQCVSISVTSKEDTSRGSYFDTVFEFELSNNSNAQVTYFCGEMIFYNGESEFASYNVYFNGEYDPGEKYKTTIEFSEYKNSALYDISFENIKITYRITSMKFNGEYKEREYDGETVTIKELGS